MFDTSCVDDSLIYVLVKGSKKSTKSRLSLYLALNSHKSGFFFESTVYYVGLDLIGVCRQ